MTEAKKEDRPKPQYRFIKPEELQFDPTNPRLGGAGKNRTPEELQAILEGPPHLALQLVTSLLENGFIPYEPLIVRSKGSDLFVIEGNRRLAAVKHIIADKKKYTEAQRERLSKLPVLVFPEQSPDAEVRNYLAVHHLFGFRDWPPLSKAVFLDSEIKGKGDVTRLVEEFGIDKQEIRRYLLPYRITRAAGLSQAEIVTKDFWILGEALARSGIKEYMSLVVDQTTLKVETFNKKKFDYLLEFLYGNGTASGKGAYSAKGLARISDTRQLSTLGRVLSSAKASEELEKGCTLEEAVLYVETHEDAVSKVLDQVEAILNRFSRLKPKPQEWDRLREILSKHVKAGRDA
jgi:hypothetical protein